MVQFGQRSESCFQCNFWWPQRVASCGQSVSNVVMTVMWTFLINFYRTANRMENVVIFYFYFPYFIYKTAKRFENGNLVEVFSFSYLRHIIDLMVKPVGWACALTMRSHISIVTQETQNFTVSSLMSTIWFASICVNMQLLQWVIDPLTYFRPNAFCLVVFLWNCL